MSSSVGQGFLYELVYNQLKHDGHGSAASALREATQLTAPRPSAALGGGDTLARLVDRAVALRGPGDPAVDPVLSELPQGASSSVATSSSAAALLQASSSSAAAAAGEGGPSLDLESSAAAPEWFGWESRFVTTHKGGATCAAFSPDGRYMSTASADSSVKLLDVGKMVAAPQRDERDRSMEPSLPATAKPIIKSLYDHTGGVTDLAFHPYLPLLASASRDATVKLFEVERPATHKRAAQSFTDGSVVRSVAWHPSGDYLLTGTNHNVVRLWDVQTSACFASPRAGDHHTSGINQVRYAPGGRLFATAGRDGAVKIWDGVSNECVNTVENAHGGADVTSLCFTRNGKYLLTAGQDSTVRLWDLSTGRVVRSYLGCEVRHVRAQVAFAGPAEDYVVCTDEGSGSVVAWNAKSGTVVEKMRTHHQGKVRWLAVGGKGNYLATASEDFRVRFYVAGVRPLAAK